MRLTRPLIVTLSLLLVGPALAQKVDLRGPAPVVGETVVSTITSESEKGKLTMNTQGQQLPGEMSTKSEQVLEVKILEVEDGEPTKVQSTFNKSKTTNTMTIFGQQQAQDDTSMQGAVMTQTRDDDGNWSTKITGGQIPAEAKKLLKDAGYVDPRVVFPEEPIGVGESWTVKDEQIQGFMGQAGIPGGKYKGDITFKLSEIKVVNGEQVAVIDFDMDSTITMDINQDGMQMKIEINMDGKGQMLRNLAHYTLDSNFAGDMDMTTDVSAGGQQVMNMVAQMPIKTETKQEKK